MLVIKCPCCGVSGEETEFASGGEAHIKRADVTATDDEYREYFFYRKNPRGVHFERWRHAFGCTKWFHMVRNTATLEIYGTYGIREPLPPGDIVARIREKHPDFSLEEAF